MEDGIGIEGLRRELEAAMENPDFVVRRRVASGLGWDSQRIAANVGVARITVRRYLRGRPEAERQDQ